MHRIDAAYGRCTCHIGATWSHLRRRCGLVSNYFNHLLSLHVAIVWVRLPTSFVSTRLTRSSGVTKGSEGRQLPRAQRARGRKTAWRKWQNISWQAKVIMIKFGVAEWAKRSLSQQTVAILWLLTSVTSPHSTLLSGWCARALASEMGGGALHYFCLRAPTTLATPLTRSPYEWCWRWRRCCWGGTARARGARTARRAAGRRGRAVARSSREVARSRRRPARPVRASPAAAPVDSGGIGAPRCGSSTACRRRRHSLTPLVSHPPPLAAAAGDDAGGWHPPSNNLLYSWTTAGSIDHLYTYIVVYPCSPAFLATTLAVNVVQMCVCLQRRRVHWARLGLGPLIHQVEPGQASFSLMLFKLHECKLILRKSLALLPPPPDVIF